MAVRLVNIAAQGKFVYSPHDRVGAAPTQVKASLARARAWVRAEPTAAALWAAAVLLRVAYLRTKSLWLDEATMAELSAAVRWLRGRPGVLPRRIGHYFCYICATMSNL